MDMISSKKQSSPKIKICIAITVAIISLFLIFYRLGYYPLWDDEAMTALPAQSLWLSGDTNALLGDNIIGYRNGIELKDLKHRYLPPLQYYLAAPFVGLFPQSALAARFPFALCGFFTILFLLYWLWEENASTTRWILFSIGLIGNVSLFLYFRQCRYFAPALLFAVLLVYLYYKRQKRAKNMILISVISLLLFTTNYLYYVGVYSCLFLDYLLWGRRERTFSFQELAIIFIPQMILGSILIYFYNPIGVHVFGRSTLPWITSKLILFKWNLRELGSSEFGILLFILAGPLIYTYTNKKMLLRIPIYILTYILVITILSPQQIGAGSDFVKSAIPRYLFPVIPLCILNIVLVLESLTMNKKWLTILLAFIAFGTNILYGGPLAKDYSTARFSRIISQGRVRSTIWDFMQELMNPPETAYGETAAWINKNLKKGQTVWILPNYATYPLMFHAPEVIYGWQLEVDEGQFKGLPDIYFKGKIPPAYIIVFGPYIKNFNDAKGEFEKNGVQYKKIYEIDKYWYDLIRPELPWHTFKEIKKFSKENEAIYIFKRIR